MAGKGGPYKVPSGARHKSHVKQYQWQWFIAHLVFTCAHVLIWIYLCVVFGFCFFRWYTHTEIDRYIDILWYIYIYIFIQSIHQICGDVFGHVFCVCMCIFMCIHSYLQMDVYMYICFIYIYTYACMCRHVPTKMWILWICVCILLKLFGFCVRSTRMYRDHGHWLVCSKESHGYRRLISTS